MSARSDLHELIQLQIDGAATESERARLEAWLKTDAAAGDEMRRMEALAATLSRMPAVEPPDDLVDAVMRAVRTSPVAPPSGAWAHIRSYWPESRSIFPYAYAAAAGAAACLLLIQLAGGGVPFGRTIPASDAAGTMAVRETGSSHRFPLRVVEGFGAAVVTRIDSHLALAVDLPAGDFSLVSLKFDPAAVQVLGISTPSGGLDQATVADGAVRWAQSPGHRVTVLLEPRTSLEARVSVSVVRDGLEVPAGSAILPGRGVISED